MQPTAPGWLHPGPGVQGSLPATRFSKARTGLHLAQLQLLLLSLLRFRRSSIGAARSGSGSPPSHRGQAASSSILRGIIQGEVYVTLPPGICIKDVAATSEAPSWQIPGCVRMGCWGQREGTEAIPRSNRIAEGIGWHPLLAMWAGGGFL